MFVDVTLICLSICLSMCFSIYHDLSVDLSGDLSMDPFIILSIGLSILYIDYLPISLSN